MNNNSKKKEAFTLIELIITMAIIGILSTSIYNGYLLIVKQTKGGELKQQSALIGKQIAEEIKSVYMEKDIEKKDGKVKLGNMSLIYKEQSSISYSGIVDFDKNGQLLENSNESNGTNDSDSSKRSDAVEQAKYEAEITMQPKTVISKNGEEKQEKQIEIADFSDSIEGYKAYIIKNGSDVEISKNGTKSEDITEDVTFHINITEENVLLLNIGKSEIYFDHFNKDNNRLNLDLKLCDKKVKIEARNLTKTPLNIYILNSDNASIDVVNEKGVLNEYYRSENKGRVGILYEINIKISDKNDKKNILYEANFVQNVDI